MPSRYAGVSTSSAVRPARASPSSMSAAVFEMSSIRSLISVRMALLDWEESTKPISPVIRTTTAHRTTTATTVRLRLFFFFTGVPLPEQIQHSYGFLR